MQVTLFKKIANKRRRNHLISLSTAGNRSHREGTLLIPAGTGPRTEPRGTIATMIIYLIRKTNKPPTKETKCPRALPALLIDSQY